jgi:HK97 family phage major capsid protein
MTEVATVTPEAVMAKAQEAMQAVHVLKSDLLPKLGKLDAFDEKKISDLSKSVGDAVELSQKAAAEVKAVEEGRKAMEAQIAALETAMSRPGAPSTEQDVKALAAKRKKLFNDFARLDDDENKRYFHSFVKEQIKDERELKALSVGSDPNGGYLVMPEFGGIVTTKIYETSPIRQLASSLTIGTDSYEVVLDNDEAAASWVGETQTRNTTSTPTLGKLSIPVNELQAMPYASQKMLDDGIIDIESWLADKVAQYFARKEATAFVAGTGNNQPRGLLSYAGGTDITQQQVEQVVTGSASTFTYAGLVNLQAALKEEYQAGAVFLIKRSSIANLLTIVDGNARPIFNLTFDKNTGVQSGIMGQSLYFANDVPAVASNALAMIYGDIKRAYLILDRIGIRVLRDPFTSKPNVQFYTTKRVGGAVVNFEAFKIAKIST